MQKRKKMDSKSQRSWVTPRKERFPSTTELVYTQTHVGTIAACTGPVIG